MSEKHIGEVVQVIGPVLDIRFAPSLSISMALRLIMMAQSWLPRLHSRLVMMW